MSRLETSLATSQREHELLKIEYEQTVAANDQAAPIAKYHYMLQLLVDELHY